MVFNIHCTLDSLWGALNNSMPRCTPAWLNQNQASVKLSRDPTDLSVWSRLRITVLVQSSWFKVRQLRLREEKDVTEGHPARARTKTPVHCYLMGTPPPLVPWIPDHAVVWGWSGPKSALSQSSCTLDSIPTQGRRWWLALCLEEYDRLRGLVLSWRITKPRPSFLLEG